MSTTLSIYLLWYVQDNQGVNIKKHAVHNMHRLAWGNMLVGPAGNCPACPCVKTTLMLIIERLESQQVYDQDTEVATCLSNG